MKNLSNIEDIAEYVRRYINEQMTEEEAFEFEDMAIANPAVAQELEFQLELSEALLTEYYNQFKPKQPKEEYKQPLEAIEKREDAKIINSPFYKRNVRYIVIAASITIILGIGWLLTQNKQLVNIPQPQAIVSQDTTPKQQTETVETAITVQKDTVTPFVKRIGKEKITKNNGLYVERKANQEIANMQNRAFRKLGDIIALKKQVQLQLDTLAQLEKDQNIQGYASKNDTITKFNERVYFEKIEKSTQKEEIEAIQYELNTFETQLKQYERELQGKIRRRK